MNESFWVGFEKRAGGDKDPSWWQKQKGMWRAARADDEGVDQILANPELIGQRMTKGLKHGVVGGVGGAGIGAILGALAHAKGHGAGIGAAAGGLAGLVGGNIHGHYTADKDFLKERGIDLKYLGLSADFSPEARKKYIDKYEK
jgi:hypothetical protein